MSERRPATTIGELDIHLGHIQGELGRLAAAVNNMATRDDIATLTSRIEKMATKDELKAVEDRLSKDSVPGTFDRWGGAATKGMAIVGLVSAVYAAIKHFSPQ